MAGLVYLDASAIVKLVVEERESAALRDALRNRPRRVSSALALVEVHLAVARRLPSPPSHRAGTVLAGLALIPIDQPALEGAAVSASTASGRSTPSTWPLPVRWARISSPSSPMTSGCSPRPTPAACPPNTPADGHVEKVLPDA